jgi:hypothetical protein
MSPSTIQSSRQIQPASYAAVRSLIRNGDLALCRGSSVEGTLISEVTGSQYTHATMLGWARPNTLMMGETRQRADGRLIDCRSEIARWPGYYDVYRVRSRTFDGNAAWTFMCHAAGSRYGWLHLARVWARRRLGQRLIPPIPNSDDPSSERFCSELVHAAMRLAGGPQCKEFDCDVTPGDLASSPHVRYLFTLFADEAEL